MQMTSSPPVIPCDFHTGLVPSTDLSELVRHADGAHHCIVCNAVAEWACLRCEATPYCSAACQAADWEAVHRDACKVVRAMRTAGTPEAGAPAVTLPEGLVAADVAQLAPFYGGSSPDHFTLSVPRAYDVLAAVLDAKRTLMAHLAKPGHRRATLAVHVHAVAADSGPTVCFKHSKMTVVEVTAGLWWGVYCSGKEGATPRALVAPLSTWAWIVGADLTRYSTDREDFNTALSAALSRLLRIMHTERRVMTAFDVKVFVNDHQATSVVTPCPVQWR
jgi:hypothetical protein